MISPFLLQLAIGSHQAINTLPLPGGSVGDLLNAALRLPPRLVELATNFAAGFGS